MNKVVILLALTILLVAPPCLMDEYEYGEYDDYELSKEEEMSVDLDDYDEYSLDEEDEMIPNQLEEEDDDKGPEKEDDDGKPEEERDKDDDEASYGDHATKAKFVETDGRAKECRSHDDCYDQREPESWCILEDGQSWTDKGCFCAANLKLCVFERRNRGTLEYSYCAPQKNWQCSYDAFHN